MARIKITETDNSWYSQVTNPADITIYAPGITTFGPEDPTLVTLATFERTFGSLPKGANDLQYDIVKSYLTNGAGVLFHRMVPNDAAKASVTVGSSLSYTKTTETVAAGFNKTWTYSATSSASPALPSGTTLNIDGYIIPQEDVGHITSSSIAYTYKVADEKWYYIEDTVEKERKDLGIEFVGTAPTQNTTVTLTFSFPNVDTTYALATYVTVSGQPQIGDTVNVKADGTAETGNPFDVTLGNLFTVTAKYKGSLGNDLKVSFSNAKETTSGKVSCYVRVDIGNYYEVLSVKDLSAGEISSNYIEISAQSTLTTDKLLRLINSYASVELTGGNDGTVANAFKEFVENEKVLNTLKETLLYDFDIATAAGFPEFESYTIPDVTPATTTSFVIQMRTVAETRGDVFYLIDEKVDQEPHDAYTEWSQFNTSYVGGFGPWCYAVLTSNNTTRRTPASYPVILEWINSVSKGNPIWYAPAGVKRASLGTVNSTVYTMGSQVIDEWTNNEDNEGNTYQANPVVKLKQYGYVLYNDATLLQRQDTGEESALCQIGTRILANCIKKKALQISLGLQFDQMSNQLIVQFKTLLSTYLDTIKYQGGINGYELIVGTNGVALTAAELNTKTIPVVIRISPTPAIRNFDITLDITQAGITFSSDET